MKKVKILPLLFAFSFLISGTIRVNAGSSVEPVPQTEESDTQHVHTEECVHSHSFIDRTYDDEEKFIAMQAKVDTICSMCKYGTMEALYVYGRWFEVGSTPCFHGYSNTDDVIEQRTVGLMVRCNYCSFGEVTFFYEARIRCPRSE